MSRNTQQPKVVIYKNGKQGSSFFRAELGIQLVKPIQNQLHLVCYCGQVPFLRHWGQGSQYVCASEHSPCTFKMSTKVATAVLRVCNREGKAYMVLCTCRNANEPMLTFFARTVNGIPSLSVAHNFSCGCSTPLTSLLRRQCEVRPVTAAEMAGLEHADKIDQYLNHVCNSEPTEHAFFECPSLEVKNPELLAIQDPKEVFVEPKVPVTNSAGAESSPFAVYGGAASDDAAEEYDEDDDEDAQHVEAVDDDEDETLMVVEEPVVEKPAPIALKPKKVSQKAAVKPVEKVAAAGKVVKKRKVSNTNA